MGEAPIGEVSFRTSEAGAHIAAVRQGLGMTTLPCFVGDADPLLVRAPGTDLHMHGTVCLLTQRRDAQDQARAALRRIHLSEADGV